MECPCSRNVLFTLQISVTAHCYIRDNILPYIPMFISKSIQSAGLEIVIREQAQYNVW